MRRLGIARSAAAVLTVALLVSSCQFNQDIRVLNPCDQAAYVMVLEGYPQTLAEAEGDLGKWPYIGVRGMVPAHATIRLGNIAPAGLDGTFMVLAGPGVLAHQDVFSFDRLRISEEDLLVIPPDTCELIVPTPAYQFDPPLD